MFKFAFLFLLLVVSCSGPVELVETKPADLIEKTQMVELISDLAIIEGHIQAKYKSVIAYHKIMNQSGKVYLKSKGITVKRYESSFDYYLSKTTDMKRIISDVIERLNRKSLDLKKKQ